MKRQAFTTSTVPTVTFWGAAQSVTGSMHLLQVGDRRVLLDCGLVRGPRHEAHARNSRFPFDPSQLDAVVLSHAHIDHCGNLPNLVRQGYRGPIFCTPATRDLVAVMLADSARIQEEHYAVAGVVKYGRHHLGPLYTRSHALQTHDQCVAVPCGLERDILPDVRLRFTEAGHILGSAVVSLAFGHAGRTRRLTFTGDLGRRGLPYLRDAAPLPEADLVLCESTYGGRVHDSAEEMAGKLSGAVKRTVARGGKVFIPAFSLGRTQIVAHFLQRWMREGLLPTLPIYIDSSLALQIAKVFELHRSEFQVTPHAGDGPVHYLDSLEESDAVAADPGPYILIASGGMCEGGRILGHLRHHIDDPRSAVVLVSYQAPGTVGAQLLEKNPTVRFHGRTWNKWAEVVEINGFSGHADHNDLLAALGPLAQARVRLVHGEPAAAAALAKSLRDKGFQDVRAPELGEQTPVACAV